MDLKHTPGPWTITNHLEPLENWIYTKNTPSNGGDIICCPPDTADSLANWPANAKLIAAAPDLLQACIDTLACLANAPERGHEKEILLTAIKKVTK